MKTWLSELAIAQQKGCAQTAARFSIAEFEFFSDSGKSLNAVYLGLFGESLEAIKTIGAAGENSASFIERMDVAGKTFSKKFLVISYLLIFWIVNVFFHWVFLDKICIFP